MSNNFIQIYNGLTSGLIDPFLSKVVLLLHMDEGTFKDFKGHTVQVNAVSLDGATKKFGNGSAKHNGQASWLEIVNSADLYFGSQDFVIEMFARFVATGPVGGMLICRHGISNTAFDFWWSITTSGNLQFNCGAANVAAGKLVADGAFHHYAVERYGSTLYVYVDGVVVGSGPASGSFPNNGGRNIRTSIWDDGNSGFNGWIDELRVTIGAARYKGATFSIPTAAYPQQ